MCIWGIFAVMKNSNSSNSKKRAYEAWYTKHKKEIQRKRRRKYRTDKRHREKQQNRVRRRYWENRPVKVAERQCVDVRPSYLFREGDLVRPGYGMRDLAVLFGRTLRTIQTWIKSGVLPRPLYTATVRASTMVFTQEEFAVLLKHADLLALPKTRLSNSVFSRTVTREMALMRRGFLKAPSSSPEGPVSFTGDTTREDTSNGTHHRQ